MLSDLIGASLVEINEDYIKIDYHGTLLKINIIKDYGDCCGYNEITANLLIDDNSKPIITKIQTEETCDEGNNVLITFFGEYKPIATLNSFSYSGSGWAYGASVTLKCEELDMDTLVSQW